MKKPPFKCGGNFSKFMLLFAVKFTHSLAILYMMCCLYIIWRYALTGIHHPFTKWAFITVAAEGIVFVAWGFECPLTVWAIELGDETGADWLSEILLLQHVEYTTNFAIFFVIGTILSLRRLRLQQS